MLPDAGEVRVLGHNMLRNPDRAQVGLSYMPQRFGLYEELSVAENLDLYADLHGLQRQHRSARYADLLEMTGLTRFTERLAGRLSGGMKQKLGIACALVHAPRLLLLDEPTVGVDPVSRQELWGIVKRFVEESGTTVLISTAYLDEADRCDEVIVLREGKSLGQEEPAFFREAVKDRTFAVASMRVQRNQLERQLRKVPGVVDAIVHGESVRVVLQREIDPAVLEAEVEDIRMEPVPPRFEDAFMDLVAQYQSEVSDSDGSSDPATFTFDAQHTDAEVIQVRDARRMFGEFCAVDNVSFAVSAGQIFGLLGANGAGKTTIFRMLCGLLPATSGTLRVAGYDLRTASARARAEIGYMAQKFSLYRDLTVAQNLAFISRAYGLRGAARLRQIQWAVESFGLGRFLDESSGQLPLGFQQRLSLAAALMHEPDVLFLDEPTSGLDPTARREFWARVSRLAEGGVTVLVTTHFMEETEYCDRLAIMADGRFLTEGTPAEIKARYAQRDSEEPTMDQAFINLIQAYRRADRA
jgi:ABC-2 type transport system ATP-binding protein